jgi:hypothetical protein
MKTLSGEMQTGRSYSPAGQIISYHCEVSNEILCADGYTHWELYIKFDDQTRNITGSIQTVTLAEPTVSNIEAILLMMYDAGNYTG